MVFILSLSFSLHAENDVRKNSGMLDSRWSIAASKNHFDHSICDTYMQIAIEGGVTNTRIRIHNPPFDEPKVLYSHSINEGSNLDEKSGGAIKTVRKLIDAGITSIAASYSFNPERVCYHIGLGMAGTEGQNNEAFLTALRSDQRMQLAVMASDTETAWLSVFDTQGIIIVSGIDSVILGRSVNGNIFRKAGFATPMSCSHSAASLSLHYGECINREVYFIDGKATWRQNIKLALLEKQLKENDGTDEQFFMKLNALARFNITGFAAMAPDIMAHRAPETAFNLIWSEKDCYQDHNNVERCTFKPVGEHLQNKDFCATSAAIKCEAELLNTLLKLPEAFRALPFAIHGTFGNILWDSLIENETDLSDIVTRKITTPVDPLAGAIKLLN